MTKIHWIVFVFLFENQWHLCEKKNEIGFTWLLKMIIVLHLVQFCTVHILRTATRTYQFEFMVMMWLHEHIHICEFVQTNYRTTEKKNREDQWNMVMFLALGGKSLFAKPYKNYFVTHCWGVQSKFMSVFWKWHYTVQVSPKVFCCEIQFWIISLLLLMC